MKQPKSLEDKIYEYIAANQNKLTYKSDINNRFARYKKTHSIVTILRELWLHDKIKTAIYPGVTRPAQVYWVPQEDRYQERRYKLF